MVLHDGYTAGSLLGDGWKQVDAWPDAARHAVAGTGAAADRGVGGDDDEGEYTDEEEELFVTLDLGHWTDKTIIGSATEYQLVGMDTPTPYLKLGDSIFRGLADHIVGDELLFKDVRDPDDSQIHTHPAFATTRSQRISFTRVDLVPKTEAAAAAAAKAARTEEERLKDERKKRRTRRPARDPQAQAGAGGGPGPGPGPSAGRGSATPGTHVGDGDGEAAGSGDEAGPPSASGGAPGEIASIGKGYSAHGRKLGRPAGSRTKNRKMPLGVPRLVELPEDAAADRAAAAAAGGDAGSASESGGEDRGAVPPAADGAAMRGAQGDAPPADHRAMLQRMDDDSDAEMEGPDVGDPEWIRRAIEDAARDRDVEM